MLNLTCSTNKPTFAANARNGRGVLRFSGTNNPMVGVASLNIRHIFIVAHHGDASYSADRSLISTPDTDILNAVSGLYFADLSTLFDQSIYPIQVKVNGVITALDSIPVPYATWKLYEIRFLTTPFPATGFNLGSNHNNTTKFKGDVGDLIIRESLALESDVWELEDALMVKYSIN